MKYAQMENRYDAASNALGRVQTRVFIAVWASGLTALTVVVVSSILASRSDNKYTGVEAYQTWYARVFPASISVNDPVHPENESRREY
jgi:hypothetical protein